MEALAGGKTHILEKASATRKARFAEWPISVSRALHSEARRFLGTTADVVAGYRFSHPVQDVICLDVDARDRDGQSTDKCFRLLSDVSIRFDDHIWVLRRGFQWNGADIPRFWQWVLGVDRHDPRVALASAFHDDVCNKANEGHMLRVVGDAIFISLLMPITYNGRELAGVGTWRAIAMYVGVRAYSVWRFVRQRVFGK